MTRWQILPRRWWLLAVAGITAAGVGARLAAGGEVRDALVADAMALLMGAAVVLAALRRDPSLSPRARRWHVILAAFFLLGAVRASLWRFVTPVWVANLVVLAAGALAGLLWAVRRLRAGRVARAERDSRPPA